MAKELKELTKRADNYSQWFNDLVVKADLAEQSAVRGCMVIKPYGYAIWEKMQQQLDKMFKETGAQNAYFPLLIPKSFLSKEAEHVEGFAKECAVVTHYRLRAKEDKSGVEVDPTAKLEEELIVRPTSETIIWNTYKNWIQSWRDLPLMCNQWCNVMRWEMRTRPFLRTSEFLWQEGHTAHATREEAEEEAQKMLKVYAKFAEEWMAVPVIQGVKSETERFAGALDTYTIEAMMQDGKALQSGTSHFLGQNFAKAFEVTYLNKENKPEQMDQVNNAVQPIIDELRSKGISVKFDNADNKRPGFKFADYELKGVPVRLVLGARDLENGTIEVMRRDTLEKETRSIDGIAQYVEQLLEDIQQNIFKKAKDYRDAHIYECENYEEFKERVKDGGFFLCHWDGTAETEARIKEETQATIRCVPFGVEQTPGVDMVTGKPSKARVIIARSY